MSRLIIKNLPPYITPERLRKHFEQKGCPQGTLTDLKVAHKQDGTSRRFGFVGYKTDQEASAAKEWFDKTFIDSARIFVNVIEGAKDAPAPRPNKRPRLDAPTDASSEQPTKSITKTGVKEDKAKSAKESRLGEFMEVMQPRTKKGPSWANETQPEASTSSRTLDVDMQDPGVQALDVEPVNQEGLSDLDWMKRHLSKKVDEDERAFEQSDDEEPALEGEAPTTPALPEAPKDLTEETILQTSRLFVRNLAFSCTDTELQELFSGYGEISQVHTPLDAQTKQSKGLAYVTFARAADAVSAYKALDRKSFQGRLLHILAAVDRKGAYQVEEADGKKRTLKDEKNAKRKAAASKDFNWSMLYMNSDAVASSVADRMNIAKSDILNPESSDNAAVKLALAETHIIQETKSYLESQGVVLSSFSSRARSETTILVKNIPYGTSEDQIRQLFEPHGTLTRVLVPPAGTMAVVDFDRPDEASQAFRAVAYRRLGNSIVYLEKGPLGIFTDAPPPVNAPKTHISSSHAITIPEQAEDAAEGEPSLSEGSTLFVKNLAFSTSTERLNQMFRNLPSFSFARVQTKPDPKRPDGRLSMGYGFVGFKDVEGARKAMKSMQDFVLDGHALHIKFAGRGAEDEGRGKDSATSKSRTTKMIVKNVPFEATRKDIRELFGSHGQLKSVRLPKKFDSRTRGFAFLDFVSRAEAENAYAALRHTHLLGRHLVLEWAEEAEQDLEVLRKKAGVGFGDGKAIPGRKRKLDMGNTVEEEVDDE
ncbi:RNA-binding domain-containing protein [Armillaria solidipes]|uniref:Multiple RNA-binding domain-containing protein 1 n=1 Tax=Armillaria solidipes TaxID=1076256 RepID=A0A2H3AQB5_9AGAR|nr:RNA-binding domain-containing protein [Armillaria solidipes]